MQEGELSMKPFRRRTFKGQITISLGELAQAVHCHREFVRQLVEIGVVDPKDTQGKEPVFNAEAAERLGRGIRLRRDLGITVASLPLILDLLERIDELEDEIERLKE